MSENTEQFAASKLGTKSYWDKQYDRELENFKDNKDIGDVWFGEDSVEKMTQWVVDNVPETDSKVLDVGCGNGNLLLALAEEQYTSLIGTDYSEKAIELAKSVAKDEGHEHIKYLVSSILDEKDADQLKSENEFDIILDKGTFDAICLKPTNENETEEKAKTVDPEVKKKYLDSIIKLLKPDGVFLITSCNWTMEELIENFKNGLDYLDHVPQPSFTFGGYTGQTVCTVAFKLKASS